MDMLNEDTLKAIEMAGDVNERTTKLLVSTIRTLQQQNAQILAMVAVVDPILAESIARTFQGDPQ